LFKISRVYEKLEFIYVHLFQFNEIKLLLALFKAHSFVSSVTDTAKRKGSLLNEIKFCTNWLNSCVCAVS
jgi:hypothetical protein